MIRLWHMPMRAGLAASQGRLSLSAAIAWTTLGSVLGAAYAGTFQNLVTAACAVAVGYFVFSRLLSRSERGAHRR